MQFLISFVLIAATTGFDVSLIPDSREVQISSNYLNDAVLPPASQSSVQSRVNDDGVLDFSEIQALSKISGEWCTRPVDSTKGQRERFDACVKRIKDCENTFHVNRYGDHKVECKRDAILSSASQFSVRSLVNDDGVLDSPEIQMLKRTTGEWCVRPVGYTEKQAKRFDACVKRIKDCETTFNVNRYGDHKVACNKDAVLRSASQFSARSLVNDEGALDSSEIQMFVRINGEWCVRPVGYTEKQRKRFHACVERIKDCESEFHVNRYGDHKVECKKDVALSSASQFSVRSLVNDEGVLDSSEIQMLNRNSGEWCTRPVDSSKGQKERFDTCVKRIRDCENTFNLNRYGDHKVECRNNAIFPMAPQPPVRPLIPLSDQ